MHPGEKMDGGLQCPCVYDKVNLMCAAQMKEN